MASYELYTFCWDSEGQEVEGFADSIEGEQMTDDELKAWALKAAREEIERQGGEIFNVEGNMIQYTYPDIEGMSYDEHLWIHGIDDNGEWDWDIEVA